MTALTVCLGARASSTQRATSLESLIREGASEARVVVKISNSGALQFKGDLYGESIIVERRFRRNGPNSFKTKSSLNGRIISERKDEIMAICDNYNIQVDNPLSILTQEMAKKFLVNSTPQNLYEFFMRATQLEQLSFDYAYALDRMKSIQNSLSTAKQSWPNLEEKIENMRIELQTIEEQKIMSQKINELKAEILWTEVSSKENEVKRKENEIFVEEEKILRNNENAAVLSMKLEETISIIKTIDTEITELYKSKTPLKDELKRTEISIEQVKTKWKECENISKSINNDVTKLRSDLKEIEEKLEEESLQNNDEEKRRKKEEIERLETELQNFIRKQKELEAYRSSKANETEDLEGQYDKAKEKLSEANRSVKELVKDLDKAKSVVKDKINFFGDNITDVIEQIKRRSKEFKYKPIGPIGMHVELTDLEWSRSMDAIIGNQLKSFITLDHDDKALLESILRSCNCQNPIINLSPAPIDIRGGEPDPRFLTALRVLKIDNEHVKKALIIFSGIEKIVLIDDRLEARRVISERLRNVDSVYTKTHRVTCTQNSLAFFAIYPSGKGNPFETGEKRVNDIERQLEAKKRDLNVFSRDEKLIKEDIKESRKIEEDLGDQISVINQDIKSLKMEIRDIEQSLNFVDETGIEVLRSEQESITSKINLLRAQFIDNIESQNVFKEEIETLDEKIRFIKDNINNIDILVEERQIQLNDLSNGKRKIQSEIENIQSLNRQISNNITDFSLGLKTIRTELESLIRKASAICERIQSNRSTSMIEREILSLEKSIAKGQAFSEQDYENIKLDYEETFAEYEKSKVNIRINENILDEMKIALEKRQRQWEDLRNGIAKRSNQDFSACLQARGYRGYLDYDHQNRELNINVHIDQLEKVSSKRLNHLEYEDSQELSKRDIKQLSGGEKSFGTTCFLLSLWDAMGCPIRCLDEFDVYMDAINRRLVVEMLINNAKNSGTQFILITPVSVLTFLDVEDRDSVHLVILNAPSKE